MERPDGTRPVRVRAHPGLCEGWGNCRRWAPDVYTLDADGRIDIHLLEVPAEHALAAWNGAESCPARAITVMATEDRPASLVATSAIASNAEPESPPGTGAEEQ